MCFCLHMFKIYSIASKYDNSTMQLYGECVTFFFVSLQNVKRPDTGSIILLNYHQ